MPTDSTRTVPDEGANRLLIVELRGGLYGIDSTLVAEIVAELEAARLPGARHTSEVVNLRGQLLTVVDLGHRLTEIRPRPPPMGRLW